MREESFSLLASDFLPKGSGEIEKKENTVNEIAEVEVKISERNEQEIIENIEILQDEIESLKEYLYTEYRTAKENIHINE